MAAADPAVLAALAALASIDAQLDVLTELFGPPPVAPGTRPGGVGHVGRPLNGSNRPRRPPSSGQLVTSPLWP
jgi:hypothetical protein